MGNTIDERVVSMRFDNQQFEKNVQISLGTLSKLKEALQFDKVDLSSISNNIQALTDKVTGMGGIMDTVLQRVSNKVVDVATQIGRDFVFNPPTDGFKEYELKMDSLKVIMESSHESLETVNKYLNELNTYSDKTIYSFSDMTASIGKFTNAGVDLDTSVKAIQGIANEAALAGASTQQASHAMYNFAQALSAGSVKLIDWKSIENANMATKDFKEELIKTAVELGTIKKQGDDYVSTTTNMQGKTSEAFNATKGFNDSLQSQWMTTEVLTTTLGRYADETTDIGARASKAATEVRTFSAMMDALKEAVGSGWAQTWEIVFGNMEEATEFWTKINDVLSGFIGKFSDARNTMLQGWKDMGGRAKLIEGISNSFKILGNVLKPLKDAITLVFPPVTGKNLADISAKFADFTAKVEKATRMFPMKFFDDKTKDDSSLVDKAINSVTSAAPKATKAVDDTKKAAKDLADAVSDTSEKNSKSAEKTVQDFEKVREAVKGVVNGEYGNGSERADALKKAGFDPEYIQNYVDKLHELSGGTWDLSDEMLSSVEKSIGGVEKASKKAKKELTEEEKAAKKSQEAYKRGAESSKKTVDEWIKKTADINKEGNLLTSILVNAMKGVIEIVKSGAKIVGTFGAAWRDSFSGITITVDQVEAVAKAFSDFSNKMKLSDSSLQSFYDIFRSFFSVFKMVRDSVISFVISILPTAINVASTIVTTISSIIRISGTLLSTIVDFITRTRLIQTVVSALSSAFRAVGNVISFVVKVLDYFIGKISSAVTFVSNYVKATGLLEAVGARIAQIFTSIGDKFDELKNKLSEKLGFKTFDELKVKLDGVFDSLKSKLLPGFYKFTDALRAFAEGENPLSKLFGNKSDWASNGDMFSLDEEASATTKAINFFKGAGDSLGYTIGVMRDSINNKLHPNKDENGNVIQSLVPIDKERLFGYKVIEFFKGFKTNLSEAIESFKELFIPGHRNEDGEFIRTLVPIDKEKSAFYRVLDFLENAKSTLLTTFESLKTIFTGKRNEKGELISNLFPIDKEGGALEKVLGFLNKAAGLLSVGLEKAVTGLTNFMTQFGQKQTGAFTKGLQSAGKSMIGFGKDFKGIQGPAINASSIADKLKALFGVFKDSVLPKIGSLFMSAAKGIKGFISTLSPAKVLSMAFAIKTLLDIIQGYKLKKALTGTISSIGGFFDGLSNALPGQKEESKTTSMLKIAAAIAIVAKAISMIASIPEDRLWSSVGIIAGIAAVLAGLAIALSKIKAVEGSDVKGATGFIVAMALALYLIAGALTKLASTPANQLKAAGIVIVAAIAVLTGATVVLSKVGSLDASVVAGPIAFAIALRILAKTISLLGNLPDDVFKKGEKNIRKIGTELLIAMLVLGHGNFNAAAVAAPLTFALAVLALVGVVALVGFIPAILLLKGMIVVKALAKVLTSAMKQLKGIKDPGVAAAPLALGLGILALAIAVVKLGLVDIGTLAKGLIVVGLLGLMMVGFTKLINYAIGDGKVDKSIIITMIAVVAAIAVLGFVAANLGVLKVGQLFKGIIAVGALGILITAIMFFFATFSEGMYIDPTVMAAMGTVVGSIVALGITAALLGALKFGHLLKGVAAVTALGVLMTAAMIFLTLFTDGKAIPGSVIATMIVLVGSIIALGNEAVLLGVFPPGMLAKGVVTIGFIATIISAALICLSKFAGGGVPVSVIMAMIVTVAALTTLGYTVALLGIVPIDMLVKGLFVITVIGVILTTMVMTMSTVTMDATTLAAPMTIVLAVIGLAAAVILLGVIPLDVILQGSAVVAGIALVLAGIMLIMGNNAFAVTDVLAPLAVVASILLLANAIVVMGLIPLDIIKQGSAVVGGIGLVLGLILAVLGGFTFDIASVLAPLAVVLAVMVLVQAVQQLGEMENSSAGVKGVIALLGALAVALGALSLLAGKILILSTSFILFAASALMIGAAFNLIADGVMKLTMAMALLAMIPTQQLAINLLVLLPIFGLFIAALVGAGVAIVMLSPSVPVLLGFSAAILMLGAGLYLVVAAIATFTGIAANIGPAIGDAAGSVADNAPKIAASIKDALGKAVAFIGSHIGPFMAKAGELVKGMVKGIGDKLPEIKTKVGDGLNKAKEFIASHIPEWLKKGGELIGKLASGIAEKAPEILKKVKEGLTEAANFVKEHLPEWLEAGKDLVGGFIKGIGEKIKDIPGKLKELGGDAIDALKEKLDSNSPSKVFETIGVDTVQGYIDGIDNTSDGVEKSTSTMGEKAQSGFLDGLKGLGAKISELFGGAKDTVESKTSEIAEAGSDSMNTMADNAESGMERFNKAASNGIADTLGKIRNTSFKWTLVGKDLSIALSRGVKNSSNIVKKEGVNLSETAYKAVKDTKDKWKNVGKTLGEGLGKGIESKSSYVRNIAKKIVSDANAAAKKAAQSKSPSKVWMRLGKYLDEGLIVGMEALAPNVNRTASEIIGDLTEAAKGPLDMLADLMSSDIVDDPVIRPVMDLSEIQNGANQLYSMIDDTSRYSLTGNVDLAADTSRSIDRDQMRKRKTEDDNARALTSAIMALKDLVNMPRNTYVIDGITYDDGSNVSDAIRTLVRAAKVGGRA